MDGAAAVATVEQELGHPVVTLDLELLPGQSRTIVVALAEPRVAGPVQLIPLPMVRPISMRATQPRC